MENKQLVVMPYGQLGDTDRAILMITIVDIIPDLDFIFSGEHVSPC